MNNDSSEYIFSSSREYAIYVCKHRAIPNVQDGLKQGQRTALWLLRNKAEKIKTVALGGMMAAEKLYVHGDVSANNAISLLAAPYKNNVPLIEGLGQFGNRIAPVEGIGAPRYTEVRRAKASEAFLYNDLDLIPLEDNYDGSNKQALHFLPLIPNVLLNGVEGVAVGWSTSILPRSLKGIIQATIDALNGAKTIKGLEPYFEKYKIKVKEIATNQYEFTGSAIVEDHSTVRITELPPGLSIENFRKRLIDLEDKESIVTFTDRSAENIDISVRFKRGSIQKWVEKDAIDFFKIKEKTTERIVVINWDNRSIKSYDDAASLVRDFVEWRLGWYTKRFEKLLKDTTYELNYWNVLKLLFDNGFTKKLGTFKTKSEMSDEITKITHTKKLVLDDEQMDRVLNLPTYRWTKDFYDDIGGRIKTHDDAIISYKDTLASPDKLKAVYLSELENLKKLKV